MMEKRLLDGVAHVIRESLSHTMEGIVDNVRIEVGEALSKYWDKYRPLMSDESRKAAELFMSDFKESMEESFRLGVIFDNIKTDVVERQRIGTLNTDLHVSLLFPENKKVKFRIDFTKSL